MANEQQKSIKNRASQNKQKKSPLVVPTDQVDDASGRVVRVHQNERLALDARILELNERRAHALALMRAKSSLILGVLYTLSIM